MKTLFNTAWDLVKAFEPVDAKYYAEEYKDLPGFSRLGEIWNGDEDWAKTLQEAIIEQTFHPSNIWGLTDAKTPTLYRAQRPLGNTDDARSDMPADRFRSGRFFSPQRLTAQQYSGFQMRGRNQLMDENPLFASLLQQPSHFYEYEMPVSLDDDSVAVVPFEDRMSFRNQGVFDPEGKEVERIAEANNMSMEDAARAVKTWRGVYGGITPRTNKGHNERMEAFRNAGYDYLVWPEAASAQYYPPTAGSAFGAVDWRQNHESRGETDDWWKPTRNLLMDELEIPMRDNFGAMGKHHGFPQYGIYHIGDEDTAPEYKRIESSLPKLRGRNMRIGYPEINNAVRIAEQDR